MYLTIFDAMYYVYCFEPLELFFVWIPYSSRQILSVCILEVIPRDLRVVQGIVKQNQQTQLRFRTCEYLSCLDVVISCEYINYGNMTKSCEQKGTFSCGKPRDYECMTALSHTIHWCFVLWNEFIYLFKHRQALAV